MAPETSCKRPATSDGDADALEPKRVRPHQSCSASNNLSQAAIDTLSSLLLDRPEHPPYAINVGYLVDGAVNTTKLRKAVVHLLQVLEKAINASVPADSEAQAGITGHSGPNLRRPGRASDPQ